METSVVERDSCQERLSIVKKKGIEMRYIFLLLLLGTGGFALFQGIRQIIQWRRGEATINAHQVVLRVLAGILILAIFSLTLLYTFTSPDSYTKVKILSLCLLFGVLLIPIALLDIREITRAWIKKREAILREALGWPFRKRN